MPPLISVVIPSRNEGDRVLRTIRTFIAKASNEVEFEFVVADDASTDGSCADLSRKVTDVSVTVVRSKRRRGVPAARNLAASASEGKILLITDAHVTPCDAGDSKVRRGATPNRIVAATIGDTQSSFRGYGCSLVVPFMGTRWNRNTSSADQSVQVASAAGTVVYRNLFWKIGGYDEGMLIYGAAEPEFSLRAWLSGARVVNSRELVISHRFKAKQMRNDFLRKVRSFMVHNNLRFGLLYLNDKSSFQMMRHFSMVFPSQSAKAFKLLAKSDVWERRRHLEQTLAHDFYWFVRKFDLTNQVGGRIL
jgi:glycosyltransferase involved in cell wall biosynthesis